MKDTATIAAGHRVIGTISASEDLLILGRVEGRIQSEATVVVEASAIIEGDIVARNVVIRGIVVGDVQAVEAIEIAPTAQVAGDLRAKRLGLRAGGRISGLVASGVDVQGYVSGRRAVTTARTAQPWSSPKASEAPPAWTAVERGIPEEVVESDESEDTSETRSSSRRRKKEPSREVL